MENHFLQNKKVMIKSERVHFGPVMVFFIGLLFVFLNNPLQAQFLGGIGRGDAMEENIGNSVFFWIGGTSGAESDWSSSGNWSVGMVPFESSIVNIGTALYEPEITGGSDLLIHLHNSMDVLNGATLTLSPGPHLIFHSKFLVTTQGSGRIILESESSYLNLSQSNPQLEVRKKLEGAKGWRMLGSPVATNYQGFLDSLVTQGYEGSTFKALQPNTVWWDETDKGTSLQGWRKPGSNLDSVVSGRGHYIFVFDGAGLPQAAGIGHYSDPLPLTMSVFGKEPNLSYSSLDFRLTYTRRDSILLDQGSVGLVEINQADLGFNLIANPSASEIDFFSSSGWLKANLDETIYVWEPSVNGDNGGFLVWNGVTGNLGSGLISPFQGFWVKTNASAPFLSIDNGAKTNYLQSLGSRVQYASSFVLKLNLKGGGMEADSYISFEKNGKMGADPMDAYQLEPLSNDWLLLYSFGSFTHKSPLVINNQSLMGEGDERSIPLHVAAAKDRQPIEIDYSLSWEVPINWPQERSLFLMDHLGKTAIDMLKNNKHTFHYEAPLLPNARLSKLTVDFPNLPNVILHQTRIPDEFENSRLSNKTQVRPFTILIGTDVPIDDPVYRPDLPFLYAAAPNPFQQTTIISFSLPHEDVVEISIYDMRGTRVGFFEGQSYKAGHHEKSWTPSGMTSGMYIIQFLTSNLVQSQKIIKN